MTYTDIVIVDGDDANRAMLCRALTGIGFSHACVRSGVEALKQLPTNTFKVALLDASFSDTDGVVTLRQRMGEMQPPSSRQTYPVELHTTSRSTSLHDKPASSRHACAARQPV
jgi:CheY-like chemotaxis protein